MDAAIRRRFRAVIEATGLDFKAASKRGGLGDTYVRDVVERDRGKLDLVLQIVQAIAPAYVDWVHTGSGSAPPAKLIPAGALMQSAGSYTAPVMGRIGAGAEINVGVEQVPPEGFYDIDTVIPLPPKVIAFEVLGDSMFPRYDAGDVVVVQEDGQPLAELRDGTEAAVLVEDGRRFLKRVLREPGGTFTLESHNAPPIRGVRLTWAADVLVMIPANKWNKVTNGHRSKRSPR